MNGPIKEYEVPDLFRKSVLLRKTECFSEAIYIETIDWSILNLY